MQRLFGFLQFPWRFFFFTTFFLSLLMGHSARGERGKTSGEKQKGRALFLCAVIVTAASFCGHALEYLRTEKRAKINSVSTYTIGKGKEYLPAKSNYKKLVKIGENRAVTATADATFSYELSHGKAVIDFQRESSDLKFTVPLIYYKGYAAQITDSNGQSGTLKIGKNKQGLLTVNVGDKIEGQITVWYKGTKVQKLSFAVSVSTALAIGASVLIKKRRRKASVAVK